MSGTTALDLRWPIGGLFTALGLLLGGYGLATAGDPAHYARSMSVNVNLWWGSFMLLFGVVLLLSASRAGRRSSLLPADRSPEGQATEAREHRLGLEREGGGG
jgi:hypothetical protein